MPGIIVVVIPSSKCELWDEAARTGACHKALDVDPDSVVPLVFHADSRLVGVGPRVTTIAVVSVDDYRMSGHGKRCRGDDSDDGCRQQCTNPLQVSLSFLAERRDGQYGWTLRPRWRPRRKTWEGFDVPGAVDDPMVGGWMCRCCPIGGADSGG